MQTSAPTDRARVVIIGWSDVILVEKAELTSGSTWHAVGEITRSVGDYTTAAFHHYAIETYDTLAERTGREISYHKPGGLRVAYDDREVAKSLAFAYVHASHAKPGTELDVLILGERRRANVLAEPAFDPENNELLG